MTRRTQYMHRTKFLRAFNKVITTELQKRLSSIDPGRP
jgi:hypothetical protein